MPKKLPQNKPQPKYNRSSENSEKDFKLSSKDLKKEEK